MSADAPAAFYVGQVLHRRLRPVRHALKHACYWMLFDIDRLDDAAGSMRLFSRNRFNVLSFHDRDHGDGGERSLRTQIEALLERHGIARPTGAVRLFCMPRVFGYGFNPLSVYFCHDADETLRAIVYEVHNTFGERHSYVFPVAEGKTLRHSCEKDFYVSPFMDIDMSYDFRVVAPQDKVAIAIHTLDGAGPMLFACLAGERREASDASALKLALSHPLATLKVIVAIHVHAAILWWKGVKVRRWKAGLRRNSPLPG